MKPARRLPPQALRPTVLWPDPKTGPYVVLASDVAKLNAAVPLKELAAKADVKQKLENDRGQDHT